MTNPYAPPVDSMEMDPKLRIRKSLSRPATALLIMSSIHSVFYVLQILQLCFFWGSFARSSNSPILLLTIVSLLLLCQILIAIGAAKMGHLESYRMGMVGMVLACIPIASPFFILGVPFGIWGLATLIPARNFFPDVDPLPTGT